MGPASLLRLAAAALFLASPAAAQESVIKFATLAPDGSTWMKVMEEFNKELQEKTGGKLKFRFYAGGRQGDEKDVVRKMRIGQLHAAGVTGVGLGEVSSEVRVLDTPFLFRDAAEIDAVYQKFDKDFSAYLEKGGFVNLGWAEVGMVYLFTSQPLKSSADIKQTKMWVWEGDAIAEACFKAFDVHPIPLSITDVMTSLQTGLIDAVYGSPMGVIALQWFTKTKYIYSVPMANASGAILVSKKFFDALPAAQKAALAELGKKHASRLTKLSREENKQALTALQKQGLTLTSPSSPDAVKQYEEIGRKARRSLAGRLYPAELLDRVEKSIEEFRASGGRRPPEGKKPAKDGKASKG